MERGLTLDLVFHTETLAFDDHGLPVGDSSRQPRFLALGCRHFDCAAFRAAVDDHEDDILIAALEEILDA